MYMRIRELRTEKGISQCILAKNCGVTQAVVSQWENEVALPRTRQLPALARVLGCSIDELFTPDRQPRPMEAF